MAQSPTPNIDLKSIFGADFDASQYDAEVLKHFIQAYTPTAEDIAHQFSPQEEMELCHRIKCQVLMPRWNPVYAYQKRLMSEGRLHNKTTKKVNDLLAKAVNKHKLHTLYNEAEIKAWRDEERRQRKKDNILRLRSWEYDREKERQLELDVFSLLHHSETGVEGEEYLTYSESEEEAETSSEENVNNGERDIQEEDFVEEDLETDDVFLNVACFDGEEYLTYSECEEEAETSLKENVNDTGDHEMREEHLEENVVTDNMFLNVAYSDGEEYLTYSESDEQTEILMKENVNGKSNQEMSKQKKKKQLQQDASVEIFM